MTTSTRSLIGAPLERVDGRLKVTGAARYSADWPIDQLAFGYLVLSTIASGRITSIDAERARQQAGVLTVMTHENAPRVDASKRVKSNHVLTLLQDDIVQYDRQPIAVVVADSFIRAKYAASLIDVRYASEEARTRFDQGEIYAPHDLDGETTDVTRGDPDGELAQAAVRVDNVYTTPIEHHNPMEPHATIACWEGDRLTVYDATQGVVGVRARLADVFRIPLENIEVITKFVGGAFGGKGEMWSHTALAAMASKIVRRPVQIAMWRPQMWGAVGFRPQTRQRVALGASTDGQLSTQIHETIAQTSMFDEFVEASGLITRMLYASPAMRVTHRATRLNYGTPAYMRAPGESTGSFALESAMDELSYATGHDPIELRLRNYATSDPTQMKPFSSKSLRECYERGAEVFGWKTRMASPCSMRDSGGFVGLGMATASYPTYQSSASASVHVEPDGGVIVRSAGVDLGTGAYTAFTQIAAEALGTTPEQVTMNLGDSGFPTAPAANSSQLTASVGSALFLAARSARAKLIALAVADRESPIFGARPDDVEMVDGSLFLRAMPTYREAFGALLMRNGNHGVYAEADSAPEKEPAYSMHAFGAQFAMVRVDPDLATVRVVKQVGAFASGRIINARTARSQYLGGMIFGLGMALLEESQPDVRSGRFMNANLGGYLVPVHADVGAMEVVMIEEHDPYVNPIGAKGVGEIGMVGAAAAIANAVFHATGKRIRDLPITIEKILT
jgi:xanthine dehydrogenase YagR molybdenum-binding subunit